MGLYDYIAAEFHSDVALTLILYFTVIGILATITQLCTMWTTYRAYLRVTGYTGNMDAPYHGPKITSPHELWQQDGGRFSTLRTTNDPEPPTRPVRASVRLASRREDCGSGPSESNAGEARAVDE